MRVVLRWDKGNDTDADLHLFKRAPEESNPMSGLNSHSEWWLNHGSDPWWSYDRHVAWYNETPDDFGMGPQNPMLDIDNTVGFGPETIVLEEATPGHYHVWVHLFNLPDDIGQTTATVEVILDEPGREFPLSRTFTKTLTEDWESWYVTTITWPAGQFINVPPSR